MMGGAKRNLVPFLLGAITGVGGLMGFQYVEGSEKLSILQHLQGDSTAVAAAPADTTAKPAPASDTLATIGIDTMPAVAIDTAAMPAGDSVGPSGQAFGTGTMLPAPRDTAGRLAPQRLAKLFGTMPAREAARVLEKMTDPEVETILHSLSDRTAASVLSNLTPERAAQISQVVLSGERSAR
jgi:hypothetical protein